MTAPKVNWSERDEKYWVSNGDEVLWFEHSLDAKHAARQIEIDNAVKAEREAIIKWLRKHGMRQVSMFIENEEHLK
jgi:hypothetical protein